MGKRIVVIGALLAGGLSAPALAQQALPPPPQPVYVLPPAAVLSGPYARVNGGYSWATKSQFDNSPTVGGALGFRFLPQFRAELEFTYRPDYTQKADFGFGSGRGDFKNYSAMLNAFFDFNLPYVNPFIPYIGGGIGGARNEVRGTTVRVSGTDIANFTGSSKNQFAWQLMAGASYYFSPTLALDVGYKYFVGGRAESGTSSRVTNVGTVASFGQPLSGDFRTNEVTASLRIGF
jgi:opacity protein-like surface antigen